MVVGLPMADCHTFVSYFVSYVCHSAAFWPIYVQLFAKKFEPLIYISISIYRVHCGKGSTRKFTSSQNNMDKHVIP